MDTLESMLNVSFHLSEFILKLGTSLYSWSRKGKGVRRFNEGGAGGRRALLKISLTKVGVAHYRVIKLGRGAQIYCKIMNSNTL